MHEAIMSGQSRSTVLKLPGDSTVGYISHWTLVRDATWCTYTTPMAARRQCNQPARVTMETENTKKKKKKKKKKTWMNEAETTKMKGAKSKFM